VVKINIGTHVQRAVITQSILPMTQLKSVHPDYRTGSKPEADYQFHSETQNPVCKNFSLRSAPRGWSFVVAAFVLISAHYANAAEISVATSDADYSRIQDAVAAASAGDVISVAAGTYVLDEMLVIDKSLTLQGAQSGVDPRTAAGLREPGSDQESILDGEGVISTLLRIAADNVIIDGFDIRNGTGDLIASPSSGTIAAPQIRYNFIREATGDEGMQIRNATSPVAEFNHIFATVGDGINFAGTSTGGRIVNNEIHDTATVNAAIYIDGAQSTTVQGNLIYNITANDGIKLGDKGGSNATDEGGSVMDNIIRDTAQDGISIYMSKVTVSGNEIYRSSSENGAILVESFADDAVVSDVEITDNNIHDNGSTSDGNLTFGIRIGKDHTPANVTVEDNTFADNEAQLFYRKGALSNADSLKTDNSFDDVATAGVTSTVNAVFGDYATIQLAIDAADAGDILLIADGSYNRVTIDKSLTLLAAGGTESSSITGNGVSQGWGIRIEDGVDEVRIGAPGHGFTVNAAAGDLAAVYVVGHNASVTIESNILNGGSGSALLTGGAITATNITGNTLTGSGPKVIAYNNGEASLGSARASSGVNFINNKFVGSGSAGLLLGVEADNAKITGNTFSGVSSYAMLELWGSNATVSGNTFAGDGDISIKDSAAQHDTAARTTANAINHSVATGDTTYTSLQAAIDNAASGSLLTLSAGIFAEHIVIDKPLTIKGAGSGDTGATIISMAGTGTAVSVSADDVTLQDIRIEKGDALDTDDGYGLQVTGTAVTNLALTRVAITGATNGLRIGSGTSLTQLTVSDSHFDGNDIAWYFSRESAASADSSVSKVRVTDSSFNNNRRKGIYTEKLSDAVFDGIEVRNSGVSADYNFNNGLDNNLK